MTAQDLLIEAAQCGLLIIPNGRDVHLRPGRLVTPDLADRLRAHKSELLARLANHKTPELVKPHRPLSEREWAILVCAGRGKRSDHHGCVKSFQGHDCRGNVVSSDTLASCLHTIF